MKSRSVGAELFHADRRKDKQTEILKKLVVAFSKFADTPKIQQVNQKIN